MVCNYDFYDKKKKLKIYVIFFTTQLQKYVKMIGKSINSVIFVFLKTYFKQESNILQNSSKISIAVVRKVNINIKKVETNFRLDINNKFHFTELLN